ncbi:MAG: hypothetical protein KJ063_02210 [Anaerolineae bacterium]|nr:hypothetical protein [Anaerolineae bacterium]
MIVFSEETLRDANRTAQALAAVQAGVTGSGMMGIMSLAVVQMQRFVSGHIEVDTGRTKNSVHAEVKRVGNGVEGVLGTNVVYSPYVRDDKHQRPFFDHARNVEGPNVVRLFGDEVNLRVERAG